MQGSSDRGLGLSGILKIKVKADNTNRSGTRLERVKLEHRSAYITPILCYFIGYFQTSYFIVQSLDDS